MAEGQPRDDHAKALKDALSLVKQLRTRVMSDPASADALGDALVEATALRLVAHRWAEAFPEAVESLQMADKLVAARGPIGPYTPTKDAARYVTAMAQMSRLQSGLGQVEAAGQSVQAAMVWKDQLARPGVIAALEGRSACWLLMSRAQALLGSGQLAAANAHADAAVTRARQAGLADDRTQLPVLLDALVLQADCRWVANCAHDAVAIGHEALQLWQQWSREDLTQLPRMSRAHLERVAAPLFVLQRDLCDRLIAAGRGDTALELAESAAYQLHQMAPRRGDQGRIDLALARADQSLALARAGRQEQSEAAAEDAQSALDKLLKQDAEGSHLLTQLVVRGILAERALELDEAESAASTLAALFTRIQASGQANVPVAVRAWLMKLQQLATGTPQDEFEELLAQLRLEHPSKLDDRSLLRALARSCTVPTGGAMPHWDNLDEASSLAAATDPAAAEREQESFSAPGAMAAGAAASTSTTAADDQDEPDHARPSAGGSVRAETVTSTPERGSDDVLQELRTRAREAHDSGDKQAIESSHEALADALEQLVKVGESGAGRELVAVLERLADAQGWWAGRSTTRRAKTWARQLGID